MFETIFGALGLPQEPQWRQAYRTKRYMEHLSEPALKERIEDIQTNLEVIKYEFSDTWPSADPRIVSWLIRWTALLEEVSLRGLSHSVVSTIRPTTTSDDAIFAKAVAAIRKRGAIEGHFLIKYGKYKHLSQTFERGSIHVAEAQEYIKESHNRAIRDDERARSIISAGKAGFIRLLDKKTGQFGEPIKVAGPATVTEKTTTSYYALACQLYCRHTCL